MAEAAAAPVLELKGLTVQLPRGSDRAHAIEKITLSVGAGEIVWVVGESGSGSSVTAQAVMGLLPRELAASAGEARLQGEDVLRASPSRLRDLRGTRMAMIFQEPMTALNPVMRVGDQIAEVLEIHTQLSEPDRRQRALQIMRAVHLPEPERLIGVYPHQLSGGQRQRIMIAAALVLDPALLIADEPTTALDVTTQAQILRLMRELQARRRTGRVVRAAENVDITVRRGETVGIVGESGSGKTTVARCVARLIEPTSGAIRIGDIDVAHLPESRLRAHRRHVQIVFQDPYRSLNPRRTVGASITEGPVNFGLSQADAMNRASRLMALVGLAPDALDRYPHQFSGGQRQRIAIARALAMEPALLIADEPVSALDVSVQAQVLQLLDDVRRRFDLAVLFITHDLRVAAQICDRIAVMQRGIVVEQGPTAEVFAAPKHEYTRALFEAAPGRNAQFGAAADAA